MDKRPYLGNSLTDQRKIWHDDAYSPSEPYWQLKFQTFKNPTQWTASILKNGQTAIIITIIYNAP